jgi:uncharacterized protein YbjT (DUF2867 family)
MTIIDPADIAAVGILALTTHGHDGQKYELASEDSFSTRELGERLSKVLNKRLTVFDDGVVSWVSTEDIAAVASVALTEDGHERKAYAQLGPEALTLTQVAEHISWVAGRRIRYVETDHKPLRDELVAAGAPPETAEHNSQLAAYAFSSGAFGVLNDDILKVTGRPPVGFAEFAVGAATAWRR